MTFGGQVLKFNRWLQRTTLNTPRDVEVLQPFTSVEVQRVNTEFYTRYFNDSSLRFMILGINPGRLGAGITGIPFTDPVQLEKSCGIRNSFVQKGEISSEFIYRMILSIATVKEFYRHFYITSVCPLGFLSHGINMNYYDNPELESAVNPFIHASMQRQLKFGCRRELAFVLGEGKNFKAFSKLNDRHGYFDHLVPLAHPRFIMQYRRKSIGNYLDEYKKKLTEVV